MFRAAAAVPSRILISQVGARVGAGRFLRIGVVVPVVSGVTGVGVAAVVEGLGGVVVVVVGSVVAMVVSFEIIIKNYLFYLYRFLFVVALWGPTK